MSDIPQDPEFEWLDHVQPVGLVLARSLLKSLSLNPERQSRADQDIVAELLSDDGSGPALTDVWRLFERVLGWSAQNVAGAPNGPTLPDELTVRLPEYDTDLSPSWAVRGINGEAPWQLLVRIEASGVEPDRRGALAGWEATPHQRFERLLRETQVHAGVLVTDNDLRLVYAPRGETSGWLAFPLRPLGAVAGRPMLGGLKLVLGAFRLFNDSAERRLPALLRSSREAQATVSTHLSAQVLGALHELLRGVHAADPKLIGEIAQRDPQHLYEGLLSVLMRLVFILYAEDRDLMPSKTDGRSRALYEQGYSVRGLFGKLLEDEARYPDTMNERVGGWGRLLALFRLVHGGHKSGWIKGRGGKLFDPNVFPFLEGREKLDDAPRITSVSDGAILRILRGLMVVDGERLSYRTLDVEQIGSVYETVMGFTVERAGGPSLAIKAGKNNKVPVFIDLSDILGLKPAERIKRIKENTGRKLTGRAETGVKQATSVDDLAAAIDSIVDERGSPSRRTVTANTPILQPTDERRRTGSHYTPRSLTEPIVRHALEPAFERIGPDAKPEDVLTLKVCDPAMGSGAFLVEACRMLAVRLVQAWARWPETKPSIPPDEDDELHARRLVAQRCLYGVDKNPMATDLAKLSLWLATLAKDHEFEFVDHALKTGDSLVGLSPAQIAAANWDENKPGLPLFRQLVKDRIKESRKGRDEIRDAPDDVFRAIQEARHRNAEARVDPIRTIGDAVISAFFAEGKAAAREAERQRVESLITGRTEIDLPAIAAAAARLRQGEHPLHPFHWQLEFPEVFDGKNPGFDAIVGNPPFLGGTRIAAEHGKAYIEYLKTNFESAGDRADLVAYFFRRSFALLTKAGTLGLIASNTIAQGDTRNSSLRYILEKGGAIARAMARLKWPGEAAVVVSVIHIHKGTLTAKPRIGTRQVERISAYLVDGNFDKDPQRLAANSGRAFEGMVPYGDGFKITASELELIGETADGLVYPFIGGKHLNNDPTVSPEANIAYLRDLPLSTAQQRAPRLVEILEARVKPDRARRSAEVAAAPWWLFWRARLPLWNSMSTGSAYARARVSSHHAIVKLPSPVVPDTSLVVFPALSLSAYAALQSRPHEVWTRFFASTLEDRLRYTPSDCFVTFPFAAGFEGDVTLDSAGQAYHEHRAQLMVDKAQGLTKIYNRFNNPNEKAADILKLRDLHDAMDRAVLTAYGWTDLAERAQPVFEEEFGASESNGDTGKKKKPKYRYRWPDAFRDEVLARLLALNAERAEQERKAGIAFVASEDEAEDAVEGDEDDELEDEDAQEDA